MKQHVFLGADKKDAERQKALWLAQRPEIKVLKVHRPSRERNLLARFGGRVPRISITVDYEETKAGEPHEKTALALSLPPAEANYNEQDGDANRYQRKRSNFLAGKTSVNVNDVAQQGGSHDRRQEKSN